MVVVGRCGVRKEDVKGRRRERRRVVEAMALMARR